MHQCLLCKRQFRYLSGVGTDVFQGMVEKLSLGWQRQEKRKTVSGRPYGVGGLKEYLLMLLIVYRYHVTQDFMAFLCGVDKATICRSLSRIEKPARRVLGVRRSISVTQEEAQALLIDATEQPVQRPKRGQKRYYSGKKKAAYDQDGIHHDGKWPDRFRLKIRTGNSARYYDQAARPAAFEKRQSLRR